MHGMFTIYMVLWEAVLNAINSGSPRNADTSHPTQSTPQDQAFIKALIYVPCHAYCYRQHVWMFIKMAHIEGQRQCRGLVHLKVLIVGMVHLKVLIVGMVHLKEAINDGPG